MPDDAQGAAKYPLGGAAEADDPNRQTAAAPAPRRFRVDWVYVTLLVLTAFAVWLPRLRGPLDLRYDAGVYYILGTSLAEGKGYRLLNEPGAIEAIQYPPLLPLFTAAHQWVLGSSDPLLVGHALRISFALLFALYLIAAYALARRFLRPVLAFLVALICGLHADMIWLSDLLFAELPFTLASLGFLLVAGAGGRRVRPLVSGVLGAIAFLLRSAGVALLAAWVADSLLRKQWRQAALRVALTAVPVLAWQVYIAGVKRDPTYAQPAYPYQRAAYMFYNVGYVENLGYVDPFFPERGRVSAAGMAKRIVFNLVGMPLSWGEAVASRAQWSQSELERINRRLPGFHVPLWFAEIPLLLLSIGILGGLAWLAHRGEWLIPMYAAGSVALIALTPWPFQFGRYLAPLTPVFTLALLVALTAAGERLGAARSAWARSVARVLLPAVVAGVLVLELAPLSRMLTRHHRPADNLYGESGPTSFRYFYYTQPWQSLATSLAWLGNVAKPGEVVSTSTPHWAYLNEGLAAVMPPFEADMHEAQRLMDAVPIQYVVIDGTELDVSQRYAAPVVRGFPDRWELIYSTPDSVSRVYRRVDASGNIGSR